MLFYLEFPIDFLNVLIFKLASIVNDNIGRHSISTNYMIRINRETIFPEAIESGTTSTHLVK